MRQSNRYALQPNKVVIIIVSARWIVTSSVNCLGQSIQSMRTGDLGSDSKEWKACSTIRSTTRCTKLYFPEKIPSLISSTNLQTPVQESQKLCWNIFKREWASTYKFLHRILLEGTLKKSPIFLNSSNNAVGIVLSDTKINQLMFTLSPSLGVQSRDRPDTIRIDPILILFQLPDHWLIRF